MAKRRKKRSPEREQGSFVRKTSCPSCNSTDNLVVYRHNDTNEYSASCFTPDCPRPYFHLWDNDADVPIKNGKSFSDEDEDEQDEFDLIEPEVGMSLEFDQIKNDLIPIKLNDRKISEEVLELYGVQVDFTDSDNKVYRDSWKSGESFRNVHAHYYPTYRKGNHVGYRKRGRFPEGAEDAGVLKDFQGGAGDIKKGIELFGQHLFTPEKHKRLFITEGELDAMAGYMLTSIAATKIEGGYAFTSMPSGANISGLKPNLEYISKFEEIYLCFDDDQAGKKLLEEAVKVLPVGKVRIVKYPKNVKDINELLKSVKNKHDLDSIAKQFYRAIWAAEKYSPAGIKSFSEGWSSYLNRGKETLIPFPDSFGELNMRTCGGYALGEIVTIAAPSSVGKSSFIKEMIYTALEKTNYKISICSFEETLDEFIEGMLSVHMSTQLNEVPYDERDRGSEWAAFQELVNMKASCQDLKEAVNEIKEEDPEAGERIHFLDHQGSCDGEALLDKIDFMIKGLDCKIIILDPVTLALSAGDMDEDEFASEIVKRTKRDKLAWINVHHVRKNQGGSRANSEGGEVAEEDMKGSGSWFQTSMINIILTRNKVHPVMEIRNTTTIKMSKCRRHGKNTGIVGWSYYDGDTGRLQKGTDPKELEQMYDEDSLEFQDDGPSSSFGENENNDPWRP